MPETQVQSLGQKDPLEEEMATHFSILAWEIPWTEETGGLQSMGGKELDMTKHSGGSHSKASVYNAGDLGSIPGSGRSAGEGNSNPFQYYCLENPMDRGV